MSNVLHIRCQHPSCDHTFDYPASAEAIEGVVAVRGSWRAPADESLLLADSPTVGSEHWVELHGPLTVDLARVLWIYYDDPLSTLNGLDTVEGIEAARFCRCRVLQTGAAGNVRVLVESTIAFRECLNQFAGSVLPPTWSSFLRSSLEEVQVIALAGYDVLLLNIQSDLGLTLVVEKGPELATIVMVHDWDFYRNVFYATGIIVSAECYAATGVRAFL